MKTQVKREDVKREEAKRTEPQAPAPAAAPPVQGPGTPAPPDSDGGPAFPKLRTLRGPALLDGAEPGFLADSAGGASLLDYFAAAAVQNGKSPAQAYALAEEMLRERARRRPAAAASPRSIAL